MITFKQFIAEEQQPALADERIVTNWLDNHLGMLAKSIQEKTKEVKEKTSPAAPNTSKFTTTAKASVTTQKNFSVPRSGLSDIAMKNGVKIGSAINYSTIIKPEVKELLDGFASTFGVKAGTDFASVKTLQGTIVRVWFVYGTSYSVLGYSVDKLSK